MSFETMDISNEIKKAVLEMGFEEPTLIQKKGIPLIMDGFDVIGQSHTGTGKTAAFAIPMLEKIDKHLKKPQVLILCPTRELSVQVSNEFRKIAKYMQDVKIIPVYGGEPINRQIMALRKGTQIVVGTPGRTLDHIRRKTLKLDHIHTIILDEADEMLKMGFREEIEFILDKIDENRQTILFSATMPQSILDITKTYQKDPKLIRIKSKSITTATVKQAYCEVKERHKTEALCRITDIYNPKRCIVFCNTKSKVNTVTDELHFRGYNAEKIHGDLKQELRLSVLNKFNRGVVNLLVATDVAARGLDIQEVDLIINYDVPEKEDYYVHRIGRSGRAGKSGRSITLVSRMEKRRLRNIEYYINKRIDKKKIPTMDQVNAKKTEAFFDQVSKVIETSDLEKHYKLVDHMVNKGYDLEKIAAALLKITFELNEKTDHIDINDTEKEKNSRRFSREPRGKKDTRDMTRLYINVGKNHKAMPRDILGAIAGESGIEGRHIGSIDMYEKFSFVEVLSPYVKTVLSKLDQKRIKGRKVTIEKANTRKK